MSKVAVITGSTGALGSELARQLVARGYQVALFDRPSAAEGLRALGAELGAAALPIELELAQASAWPPAIERVQSTLGPVSAAVLIAGGWQGGTPLHEQTDDSVWRAMLDANLETAHAALRGVLPGMVARKHGSVVVIGSQAVERPWTAAGAAAYATSKSAVAALARVTAQEVLVHGVRINAVLPSTLDTAANRRAMPDADPARWVSTASASEVIAFLLSDAARDVSGALIPLYGRA